MLTDQNLRHRMTVDENSESKPVLWRSLRVKEPQDFAQNHRVVLTLRIFGEGNFRKTTCEHPWSSRTSYLTNQNS